MGAAIPDRLPHYLTRWYASSKSSSQSRPSGDVSQRPWMVSPSALNVPSQPLQPGDILLLPRVHTLIFAGWADAAHTQFNLYEQHTTGHPARYTIGASITFYLARGLVPHQYNGITDHAAAPNPQPPPARPTPPAAARTPPATPLTASHRPRQRGE